MVTFAVDAEELTFDSHPSEDAHDDSDHEYSTEFRAQFGSAKTPIEQKSFSYDVVGRLSRWEGGNGNPYENGQGIEKVEPEKITFWIFLRQFCHPSYDLTEVTIEDIDRTKLMHDRFLGDSQFNFNYTTLLIIASVIAAMGLANNGSASIIASMLVSPLMGPVTSIAYGISIGDYKMVRMGLVTEIVSLIICIIIGVIFAGAMLPFKVADNWPVEQMLSRGTLTNLRVGIPIAFFSGLGVAVGILDSQTNSLVGVAISASLLPPAVNAGMLWVIFDTQDLDDYPNEAQNYAKSGLISLSLTIVNVIFIIIASMLMFRLKETLPIEKSIFWTDLGIARKIYHNVAILPKVQTAPNDAEIKKRVTTFFPRASAMILQSDFRPENSNSSSIAGSSGILHNSSYNKSSNLNSSIPRESRCQWSNSSNSASNSAQAVRGIEVLTSINE
ncbi:DUF389-domain-containing protein [Fragilariopsis cylindrus CCMP1102]|uniref:DUF389-domain-containing protein n=1 Tax=Fragilariopsis cylindrus CCMP1102 TaxID=635003 RepID=A0A1E7FRN1_9STRA|nr:DUF389-domain-containing protein [Fragilariopsis cylindrus CCMP1102]|eukprot:OEU20832.1 DUF389-domain-containing protein [Fragilariopsis cylindrus CCMP1102]